MSKTVMTKTKVSTKTKVAVGIALAAGGLIVANMLIKYYPSSPTTSIGPTIYTPTPVTHPTFNGLGLAGFHLSYGSNTIHRVNVVAPAGHDLSLDGLAFRVDLNLPAGFTMTFPYLYGPNVMGTFVTDGSCGFTPTATSRCLRVPFASEMVIPAGTSKSFTLGASVNSPIGKTGLVAGDSISTTLLGDGAAVNGAISGSGTTLGVGGTPQNAVWSDMSASPHSLTSSDWWNGNYAYGLSEGPQAISYP